MTQQEVREMFSRDIQIKFGALYSGIGLLGGIITLSILCILFGSPGLLTWVISVAVAVVISINLIDEKIVTGNLVIPAGSEGVPYFQGELLQGVILKQMETPYVRSVWIPFSGVQKMLEVEIIPEPNMVIEKVHTLRGITTKGIKGRFQGVEIAVPLSYHYKIHDQVRYAERNRAQRVAPKDSRVKSELVFESVLDTIGKKITDQFTYDQIDDSLPATSGDHKGDKYREAILKELKSGHKHGAACVCSIVPVNGKDTEEYRFDDLGITVVKVLPKNTLATNTKFLEKRDAQAIEHEEKVTEAINAGTMVKVASYLRKGIGPDGKKIDFPDGKNPFENMSDSDILAAIERRNGTREKPKEYIISGGTAGNGNIPPVVMAWLMQQMQNNP